MALVSHAVMRNGAPARLTGWRGSFQPTALETPWRVGPLVALAEPAIAALGAVVFLLLAMRAGASLAPGAFLAAAIGLTVPSCVLGRLRVFSAFRSWARVAAELPFPLGGADRLLRRSVPQVRVDIRLAVPMPVELYLLRAVLDSAALPGVSIYPVRCDPSGVTVMADGPAWLAARSVRRLLRRGLLVFHEAFPVERVELCPPVRLSSVRRSR
jgi:hypothetical protein